MQERGKLWEAKQREDDLQRRNETLGTENTRLKGERDRAIREKYENEEEAIVLRNQNAAKDDEIRRLREQLSGRDNEIQRLNCLIAESVAGPSETEADQLRQDNVRLELELMRSNDRNATLEGEHRSLEASFLDLSDINRGLRAELETLKDVKKDAEATTEENRFLRSRINLLTSQVGSYMVGNRVTLSQYMIIAAGNLPGIGKVFRHASERVYKATHDQALARKERRK